MKSSTPAFSTAVSLSSFRTSPLSDTSQLAARRPPPPLQPCTPKAVLDTPAKNTYMQRQAEVAVRDFLTRRAVNTVMYYMDELGDGPTHRWLSNFDNFAERVKAHDFKNGDAFLERMRRHRPQEGTVRIGHPSGRFSRTFKFTIEPQRIAHRIAQSRVQLAKEWARDLGCVEQENLELQRLSFERMVVKSERELDSRRNLIFDTDPFVTDHTPLRWKNYQGLKTLVTQHAVARLLPYMRDYGSNHEYMYLLQTLKSYGPIADGDQFLNDLMAKHAETRTNPTYTVVPKSIAVQIMELRTTIAEEWIAVMEFVPEEYELTVRGRLEQSLQGPDLHTDNGSPPKDGDNEIDGPDAKKGQ